MIDTPIVRALKAQAIIEEAGVTQDTTAPYDANDKKPPYDRCVLLAQCASVIAAGQRRTADKCVAMAEAILKRCGL